MPIPSLALSCCAVALLACAAAAFEWESARPEDHGLSASRLEQMTADLKAHGTKTLLIIRHDKVVWEWYAEGYSRTTPHYTASLAKALVGGMSFALALDDGRLSPDDLACKYVRAWSGVPRKSRITLRHLATHTSGIEDAEHEGTPHDKLPGWMGEFWARKPNPFLTARDDAPVLFEPGTQSHYSNPGMAMLAYCVTAALKDAPQSDIKSLLAQRIMEPLGIPQKEWSISYGQEFVLDGLRLYANWGGGGFSPNAVARIGRLMLRRGNWDGKQLIGEKTVDLVARDAGLPLPPDPKPERPRSGLCWWLNAGGYFPRAPRDLFAGAGAGNQLLIVIPSLDMILVRNGAQLDKVGFWEGVEKWLLNPLMEAVTVPPYPPSPVIKRISFAPEAEITRAAIGSDNWPLTWGDDGAQYTSYGDGWGFEPRTEKKLSLGLARIVGPRDAFRAENLRSETAERVGDGPKGAKTSGMLMVDGVLCMLVRNLGNTQLAWSKDRGKTWTWGLKFETSFGCPCFLNFGANYAGARDDYVYLYSSDGPSAYEHYDGIVLARVPKDRITELAAYEFFCRLDDGGKPVWSADISQRGPVFRFPGHCQRTDAVYNPGLKRYLLAVGFNHEGGWGIFDAPEPWGPWTTAFYTDDWGLGGTHGYRLPAAWISPDGKTMHLVYSGKDSPERINDAFCVRRMEVETY